MNCAGFTTGERTDRGLGPSGLRAHPLSQAASLQRGGRAHRAASPLRAYRSHGRRPPVVLSPLLRHALGSRWFALNRKVKLPATAGGASGHGSAPWRVGWTSKRCTMGSGIALAFPKHQPRHRYYWWCSGPARPVHRPAAASRRSLQAVLPVRPRRP